MILGIESSCDETGIAVFEESKGIVFEKLHSQLNLHELYGGVVPDLAIRDHMVYFPKLLMELWDYLKGREIDKIAVTEGPGLAGCLAVGVSVAKAVGVYLGKPVYGVNHLRAHALSVFMNLYENKPEAFWFNLQNLLPHLGCLVSGGNTILFKITEQFDIVILAQTVDDAAGEAFDKGAKLLGLPYPGGVLIEKNGLDGDFKKYNFPKAFPDEGDWKLSFSGLKTSLRYLLEKMSEEEIKNNFSDICASYQKAIVDQLVRKLGHIAEVENYKSIGLSGGVANNKLLTREVSSLAERQGVDFLKAKANHSMDNAAMIAFAFFMDQHVNHNKYEKRSFDLKLNPSLTIDDTKSNLI